MNNFFKRTLTAGGFVAILLCSTYFSHISFSILFLLITVAGILEFYSLAEKEGNKPQKITGVLIAILFFISNVLVSMKLMDANILLLNIPLLFFIFIIELYTKSGKPFVNIAFTLLGIMYVAIPFSLLNYILTYGGSYNYEILFGIFFITWSNDTGAYLAGSTFGKNKLFPRVSPGKSWEGSIGGALVSFIVAYIISGWYTDITKTDWMIIASILIIVGTLGDLVESLYKRSLNVKDSGTILPGHGGILDRFDSLLMATPFVFTYLYLIPLFR